MIKNRDAAKSRGINDCTKSGKDRKEQNYIDSITNNIIEREVSWQHIDLQMIEEANNAEFNVHVVKIIKLERELEEKVEEYDELEVACKEAILYC